MRLRRVWTGATLVGLWCLVVACSSGEPGSDAGLPDDGSAADGADSGEPPGDDGGDEGGDDWDAGPDDGFSGDDGLPDGTVDGTANDAADDGGPAHDDQPADAADAGDPDAGDQAADEDPGQCSPYPLELYPDPGAQARAEAALADLAPAAFLAWSAPRGTLTTLTNLNLPLDQCQDTDDIFPHLFAITAQAPDLFQIDPEDWGGQQPFECRHVSASNRILPLNRIWLGGNPVQRDVFSFIVKREGATVELKSVSGTYLPPASDELTARLNSCPALDEQAAEALVRGHAGFDYVVFEWCNPIGSGAYVPAANDTVEFDPVSEHYWSWHENSSQVVLLSKHRTGRLIIHPDNYTDDLLSSNAACPSSDGIIVGFNLYFDSVTGQLLGFSAGIGCIVC